MNTVYILWLRQIKRHFRSRSRVIGSLGQPLLFLLALNFGFGPIYERAGGGNYIQFLAPGVIATSILLTGILSGIETISDKQFGFLKETLVAPVSRFNIMIGRTLGGATVATLQGIIVLLISFFTGFKIGNIFMFPLGLIFMFLIALLFSALGTVIASVFDDMQGFQLIMNFLIMPLFFLSGALFPLQELPQSLRIVAGINPLSYAVDGLRGTLVNGSHIGLALDFSVLVSIIFILISVGSYFFSKIEA